MLKGIFSKSKYKISKVSAQKEEPFLVWSKALFISLVWSVVLENVGTIFLPLRNNRAINLLRSLVLWLSGSDNIGNHWICFECVSVRWMRRKWGKWPYEVRHIQVTIVTWSFSMRDVRHASLTIVKVFFMVGHVLTCLMGLSSFLLLWPFC